MTVGLPGSEAQDLMSPRGRTSLEKAMNDHPKPILESAVLLCLYPKMERPHFVLMERNCYSGPHSGQISLPGGKKETHDVDLRATALREFEEEIGVSKSEIDIVGNLTPVFIPPSSFFVQPLLAYSHQQLKITPDPVEVCSILEVDLIDFMADPRVVQESFISGNRNYTIKAPAFNINGHKVWGATAMILSEFLALSKRWQ